MAVRLDEVRDPALLLGAGLQQAPRQLPRPLPRPALRLPPRPRRLARLVPGAVVLSTAQHSASEIRSKHFCCELCQFCETHAILDTKETYAIILCGWSELDQIRHCTGDL